MSAHWLLALRCAAWVVVLAVVAAVAIFFVYGGTHAGAFLYGAGAGLVSFVSMAITVSWLTRGSKVWQGMGVASFVARYGFAMVALAVPAYLGLWPAVAMLAGFAGVYLAENVVFLPLIALRMLGTKGEAKEREADHLMSGKLERRAEV
ncbi:MAG: hypothetical protein ACR2GU_09815 [Rubrobacteraceae bacterium]